MTEERCTCGSGGHPRECAKHPEAYEAHIRELNYIHRLTLRSIKDPDGFGELAHTLELTEEQKSKYFEWGEYANIEVDVKVDDDGNLVIEGGRFLPVKS